MNPLLERYIRSSIAKHFRSLCTANSIVFFADWEIRDTGSLKEWVELRVIGPEYHRLGDKDWLIGLEVDLLVTTDQDKTDLQRLDIITGLLIANCENIPIYSSNNSVDFLFCVSLDTTIDKNLRTVSYGNESGITQRRASVMAIYETETTITI